MFNLQRIVTLLLIFTFILGWITPKGQASSAITPQELLQQLKQNFAKLKDYQCQMTDTKYKAGKPSVESRNYYFKKPQLIRIEVTGGSDKGAVAVYNSAGKVRAHAGGILGLFTITMEPNDKRLQEDDGSTFVDSHLGVSIRDLEQAMNGATVSITEVAQSRKLYQVEINRPNKRQVILVDAQQLLPIQWDTFTNGQLEFRTEWQNFKADTGLADSLFSL